DSHFIKTIEDAKNAIVSAYRTGHKVLFAGNGGSAADAQHLAAELSGRFYLDRLPLDAEALHVNTSYLTAVANDYSYDNVYLRAVMAKAKPGDVLVAISTSGNSVNILNAMKYCKEHEIIIIGLTGKTGGKMKDWCDFLLNVPSTDTPRIQEAHIMIGHIICELVEKELFA
ncbi:MAG: SIS domain-containing protein, partial [Bacteroidales bacterium]|nr:SIS domain-containing protein [Bacteroidales bacterium]